MRSASATVWMPRRIPALKDTGMENKKKDMPTKMALSEMYDCRVLTGNSDEIGRKLEIWIRSPGKQQRI